jgi:hypothetical protein
LRIEDLNTCFYHQSSINNPEGVLDDGQAEAGKFLQTPPAACDAGLLGNNEIVVHQLLGENALTVDRLESGIDDVLSQRGIAADVSFGQEMELFRRNFAEDIAEVEVGLGDLTDILAAHFAQITLFAARHGHTQNAF